MNNFLLSTFISFAILCNPVMVKEVHPSFVAQTEQQYIYYNIPLSEYQQKYTQDLCNKYDMSYELVLAVMKKESDFNSNAVSYTGSSQGIMQLNRNTSPWIAKQLGAKTFDPFNFGHNVHGGIWYLAYQREHWQNKSHSDEQIIDLMLSSYNLGLAGCKEKGIARNYVDKVRAYKCQLENGDIGEINN